MPLSPAQSARRDWLSLLAKAPPERLAALFPDLPAHQLLRAPEIGTVMVQGRTGGSGAPFSLGEMTVTRAALRLQDSGTEGHAMVQGRARDHALRVAALDALLQTRAQADLEATVLAPLRAEAAARQRARARRVAATRVEFFTLARGEDR